MTTDYRSTFDDRSHDEGGGLRHEPRPLRGRSTSSAGIGPEDVDVVELHDCFTANELISYEALGLTPRARLGGMV